MSYIGSLKLYCKFENTLLLDSSSGDTLSSTGADPSVVTGYNGNGMKLDPETLVYTAQSLNITNSFTISFWLKPSYPGIAVSPANAANPMRSALMSRSGFSYNSGNGQTSLTNTAWVISEESMPGGVNSMKLYLKGSSTEVTVQSVSYTPNEWHHFWIVYAGSTSIAKIYVDGGLSGSFSIGVVPATLSTSTANFEINNSINGQSHNVTRNTGVLDDLFILNSAIDNTEVLSRAANLGADYVLDIELMNFREMYSGMILNDPASVQVTGVSSNNADLLLGRSDGSLLRGYRSIWQHRRLFAGQAEENLLNKRHASGVTVDDGIISPSVMIRA